MRKQRGGEMVCSNGTCRSVCEDEEGEGKRRELFFFWMER